MKVEYVGKVKKTACKHAVGGVYKNGTSDPYVLARCDGGFIFVNLATSNCSKVFSSVAEIDIDRSYQDDELLDAKVVIKQ